MNEKEFKEYVDAYEAWWKATEYFNVLLERCLEGDDAAIDEVTAFTPELDKLHTTYLQKKQNLGDLHP